MAIETALAKASLTPVDLRDPVLLYNRKTPAQLAAVAPGIDWSAYFTAQKIPAIAAVDVQEPEIYHQRRFVTRHHTGRRVEGVFPLAPSLRDCAHPQFGCL